MCSTFIEQCAMKVKSRLKDVDHLISKIKVQNKTRQVIVATIGCLLLPVITSWVSYLPMSTVVKPIETIEIAKHTIKNAMQTIQELEF